MGMAAKGFAHYAAAECRTDYRYHPESPAHREAKAHLAGLLREHTAEYTDAQIAYEVPIPEVKRVADILIVFGGRWIRRCVTPPAGM